MSKAVYTWDSDNHLDKIKLVNDDYKLEGNETFTKPEDGLYEPITHTGVYPNDTWSGVTKEEWEAAQPKIDVQPSPQQVLNAQLTTQLAQLKADSEAQKKINAQLTLQNAQLAKQLNANKEA